MATFLINCANIKVGGGIQVADSICRLLDKYCQHEFVVVTSSKLHTTKTAISNYPNVRAFEYDMANGILLSVLGRDQTLDRLVDRYHVDAVLTVFGPPRWKPRCPHLCGFARAHIVQTESPYFRLLRRKEYIKVKFTYHFLSLLFRRNADYIWTENPSVAARLVKMYRGKTIYVVSNYYNQVFDSPDLWQRDIILDPFPGVTCLTISAPYVHKNLPIMLDVCNYMEKVHPDFHFRFALTLTEEKCRFVSDNHRHHFVFLGTVDIRQCPSLYEQADIMFMPSLMECFSATYPEAMKMGVPIVTTDLDFSHGLCDEAACYYSAMDAEAAAEAIYKVATDKSYAQRLVDAGKCQLKKFDNYEQRTEKMIQLLEKIVK